MNSYNYFTILLFSLLSFQGQSMSNMNFSIESKMKGKLKSNHFERITELNTDIDSVQVFRVFPNPAVDIINISTTQNGPKLVAIFDVLGKKVFSAIMERNGVLDVKSLNSGVYIIKVEEDNKTMTNKLIIY